MACVPSRQPESRLRDIVFSLERIDTIIDTAGRLEAALAPGSIFRDALERRLLIISEAAVKLGADVESQAPEIDWRGVRGSETCFGMDMIKSISRLWRWS
jgi:uncharacterized protein with HEPN domain